MELSHERPVEGVFLPRRTEWVVGIDLGQSMDFTAVAVIEHVTGLLSFNSEYERHTNIDLLPTKPAQRLNVKHLQRLPLGMTYPQQVEIIKEMLARPPLNAGAKVVLDASGVGRPVADLFRAAGINFEGVVITAGEGVSRDKGYWHVSKSFLVAGVDALLNTKELRFAAALTESGAMKEELANFRRKLSDAGRASYAARTGASDDLVLAVAITCWWISRPPPPVPYFTVGSSSGRLDDAQRRRIREMNPHIY